MAIEFVVYISPLSIRREILPCQVAILVGIGLRFKGIRTLLYSAFLKEEKPVIRPEQPRHRKGFADDRYGK